jgi:hypothetical protein
MALSEGMDGYVVLDRCYADSGDLIAQCCQCLIQATLAQTVMLANRIPMTRCSTLK